jgi:hypothetical protein
MRRDASECGAAAFGIRLKKGASPQKFGETSLGDLEACNSLKSHKTAKDLFGKAWRKAREVAIISPHLLFPRRRGVGLERELGQPAETTIASER